MARSSLSRRRGRTSAPGQASITGPRSRAERDRASLAAKRDENLGPNPTDRSKPGTTLRLVSHPRCRPLGLPLSGSNRRDRRMVALRSMACRASGPGVAVAHAAHPPSFTPTRRMTTAVAVECVASAASSRAPGDGDSRAPPCSAATGEWWSAPSPGSPDADVSRSTTSAAQTSTLPSPPSPVRHLPTQLRRFVPGFNSRLAASMIAPPRGASSASTAGA